MYALGKYDAAHNLGPGMSESGPRNTSQATKER